ncbi:unnamed protein product, partial [marine sediment metagenome]
EYCKNNGKKVIREIEEQIEVHLPSTLIIQFLRIYIKDKLIEWFTHRSERSKGLITLEMLRRRG